MKYELDTIPVWDALRADTECLFCLLERRSRSGAVRYFLGPSVMVPEVRVEVNEIGFSAQNARILSKDPNRLGLGLVTHTRLKHVRREIERSLAPLKRLANGASSTRKLLDSLVAKIAEKNARCLIQDKIDDDLRRYAFTFLHLFQKDGDFATALEKSKGCCFPHSLLVLQMAGETLSGKALNAFLQTFLALFESNLERVETDLLGFTQTFDSTGSHEIQGNPEKALERGLLKLYGAFAEYEEESKTYRGPLMGT